MDTNPMVFQFIGETVKNATDAFVQPAATNLIFALQMLVLTGVTLYITITGYMIMTGAIESAFWTFAKQCLKIIIIAAFALTIDGYLGGVVDAINGLENGLSQALNSTNQPASIYQVLDQSLGKGLDIVAQCFQKSDDAGVSFGSAIGWAIAGLIVATGTILMALLGGAVVIVAKFSLAVMFGLGPLFIVSLMFPATARFFDSWFSQVMNYIVTIVIMGFIMTFATKSFDVFVASADLSGTDILNPMFVSMQIGTLTGVLCWIILQATSMASGLAGGISMAAMGIRHMLAPVSSAKQFAGGVRNNANPMTTRRDMQSGMMVTARRGSHLIAGNTMWNPAYRQHVISNIGKNWGKASGGRVSK
ncbi:MAG TPA: type IV secretion system protein [Oligoflexus sp.]|uniref:type IV secretion system protein n=1 Tax=Oligoflexus sp. TaxID=1971216 RepID=UPI002D801580|nr:type IV secretion system protein [Oligoflexus sp.]HET9239203.1 type IV secretion system protein [Oligoflexus sp.]